MYFMIVCPFNFRVHIRPLSHATFFFFNLKAAILRKAELAIFIMISKHSVFHGVDVCVQVYKQWLVNSVAAMA